MLELIARIGNRVNIDAFEFSHNAVPLAPLAPIFPNMQCFRLQLEASRSCVVCRDLQMPYYREECARIMVLPLAVHATTGRHIWTECWYTEEDYSEPTTAAFVVDEHGQLQIDI